MLSRSIVELVRKSGKEFVYESDDCNIKSKICRFFLAEVGGVCVCLFCFYLNFSQVGNNE